MAKPIARWGAGIGHIPTVGTVIFGGRTDTNSTPPGYLGDTWLWTGSSFTQINPTTSPSPRAFPIMGYNGSGITLSCGNNENINLSDTYTYSGGNWTFHSTTPYASPTTLTGSCSAWQSGDGYLLVVSGKTSYERNYSMTNWSWVSNAWSQLLFPLNTASSPPARVYAGLASTSLNAYLFGGKSLSGPQNDFWEFSGGTSWTKLQTPTTISPRFGNSLTYDPGSNSLVLFGGCDANTYLNETWVFSIGSGTWSKINPTVSPPPRAFHSMVYDVDTGLHFCAFGVNYAQSFSDVWTFNVATSTWNLVG